VGERCGARGGGGEAVGRCGGRGGGGGGGEAEVDVDVEGIVEAGGAEGGLVGAGADAVVLSRASATACRMGEVLGVAGVGDGFPTALRSGSRVLGCSSAGVGVGVGVGVGDFEEAGLAFGAVGIGLGLLAAVLVDRFRAVVVVVSAGIGGAAEVVIRGMSEGLLGGI